MSFSMIFAGKTKKVTKELFESKDSHDNYMEESDLVRHIAAANFHTAVHAAVTQFALKQFDEPTEFSCVSINGHADKNSVSYGVFVSCYNRQEFTNYFGQPVIDKIDAEETLPLFSSEKKTAEVDTEATELPLFDRLEANSPERLH